ncbi:hypothetical protein BDQ17DRAFT_1257106, partial [Cyathus striatus]
MEQGDNPDFYAQGTIPGRPRLIGTRSERVAVRAIKSGECRDATDAQRKLFPNLDPTTVHRMFIRKGYNGCIWWKKPWLSHKHV